MITSCIFASKSFGESISVADNNAQDCNGNMAPSSPYITAEFGLVVGKYRLGNYERGEFGLGERERAFFGALLWSFGSWG